MRFQEAEEHVQLLVTLYDHIVVQESCGRDLLQLVFILILTCCTLFYHIEVVDLNVLVVPL